MIGPGSRCRFCGQPSCVTPCTACRQKNCEHQWEALKSPKGLEGCVIEHCPKCTKLEIRSSGGVQADDDSDDGLRFRTAKPGEWIIKASVDPDGNISLYPDRNPAPDQLTAELPESWHEAPDASIAKDGNLSVVTDGYKEVMLTQDGRIVIAMSPGALDAPAAVVSYVLAHGGLSDQNVGDYRELLEWAAERGCEMEADDFPDYDPKVCSKDHTGRCWPCEARVRLAALCESTRKEIR